MRPLRRASAYSFWLGTPTTFGAHGCPAQSRDDRQKRANGGRDRGCVAPGQRYAMRRSIRLDHRRAQVFTAAGFGNWFSDRCNAAGLPQCSDIGLRKAGAALAAEKGASVHELMAIFGWLTMKEAEPTRRRREERYWRVTQPNCWHDPSTKRPQTMPRNLPVDHIRL
jgi:hypothetical protein